uniref:Ubiquitin-like protease family profile domain-containing protein n=1 Tax=Odontella aurita TaxID=265563 RepID=A0A7S4NIS5_9STRA|mmetsp:Transcript_9497/g.28509  ORF Transcript_9497/g.28509 Transcript_9497/m.28509 type:complete len:256 (+) Transcript_9497:185-952(+)|eukprot:CAMPEP_0113545650 /NCGR_PEP_ID=MMETSP0015_2-20120614/11377_1 /TAXON_ID=2838 /ORGANISM="Odontella" /LENGTH=255 /DNA_ID=CAMNT_0000446035 /DNA_START=62 /DNA_END=826 /DNA_ORIENTATION=+ /assembly_acc=CAM_ASM_000160
MSDSNLLVNYHDACVYESDLRLLESPTAWLNDACILFRLNWISQIRGRTRTSVADRSDNVLFLDPSVISFMMHQCDDDDLADLAQGWKLHQRKVVFVPVNDNHAASAHAFQIPGGGNHWSMMVVLIGMKNNSSSDMNEVKVKYLHFDSSVGCNERAARLVARRIQRAINLGSHAGEEAVVIECRTPQQNNGYDCGIFALGAAEALSDVSLLEGDLMPQSFEMALASFVADCGAAGFAGYLRHAISNDIKKLAGKL